MLKGLIEVGKEYWETGDDDIYYNVNDIFLSFNSQCNIFDTVQGTIAMNFIGNRVKEEYFGASLIIRGVDALTLIMDISDLARLYSIYLAHRDIHVVGTVFGKLTKLLAQAYMSGLLDYVINIVLFLMSP